MKSTLFIFAVLFGAALADEATSLEAKEEGRLFVGLSTIGTLIGLGTQIIILLALINFVTSLKGSIDFDNLFGKGGGTGYDYGGYETGYPAATGGYAPVGTGGHGSSYESYRREATVQKRSLTENPMVQALTSRVYAALEKFNH